MSFFGDLIFGYSSKREYIGQLNFRNVISMQVQHIFTAMDSTSATPAGMPPFYTGCYTGIVVNGINFGTGRITSFNNPVSTDITENGRHLWKQTVGFEVYESGDLSNISNVDSSVSALLGAYNQNLASLDENFSFDISQNGDYQYGHTVSVRCVNEPSGAGTSGYVFAQQIASGLLTSTPPFGYIDPVHSGFYNLIGKRTYTEQVDIFNGAASFEEKFIIQSRDFVKHSVTFDNGFANITESATIRHSGISKADDVFGNGDVNSITTKFNNAFGGAYTRCNVLYDTYTSVLGADAYATTLALQPIQITKTFDERTQELNYNVLYTNNPNMGSSYTIEREQSFSQNQYGVSQISEAGTLSAFGFKDPGLRTSLVTWLNSESAGAASRLHDVWSNFTSFKQDAENKSVSVRGKKASYSISYTNDPSFYNDGTYLTKNINIQDNEAIRVHQPYFIIGRKSPLVHNPGQTQFGNVTCTINAVLPRPAGYYAAVPIKPIYALNLMFVDSLNLVLTNISSKAPLDMYVTKVAYSYSYDFSAEMVVEAQYVYPRLTDI